MRYRFLFIALFIIVSSTFAYAEAINDILLVDTFDHGTTSNLLGGETSGDEESLGGCIPLMTENEDNTFGFKGHSLQLEYDVTIPSSFSFYTTPLGPTGLDGTTVQTRDLRDYNYFSFWYKTDKKQLNFSVEIHRDSDGDGKFLLGKDSNSKITVAKYTQNNAPNVWHKVTIPLKNFKMITDWNDIVEVVFVFEQALRSGKGTVFVDDILFGSNYPEDDENLRAFPDTMRINLLMLNELKIGPRFVLKEHNEIEILLKNTHPLLESITVEASKYGDEKWFTVARFYDHATGLYSCDWDISATQKEYYFLRVVGVDLFGRSHILLGPFGGAFDPQTS